MLRSRVPIILLMLVLAAGLWTPVVAQDASPAAGGAPTDSSQTVQSQVDVVYGEVGGETLLLDIEGPAPGAEPHPAVILIHGGGLVEGERYFMTDLARALAEAGYVTFNITYRLFGSDESNLWPSQLDDVQRAVRWLRANAATYGVDPERVCALGHSSGGHLAALLGTRETRDNADPTLASYSSRVTCVVDLSGEADLTMPESAGYFTDVLGGTPEEVPDAYRDASPLFHVDEETVPFLILHGGDDEAVPIEQSRRMAEALQTDGIEVIYGEFPGESHRATMDWRLVGPFTLAFLDRHLEPGG
jgi:acetyl esterase/lipase